MAEVGSLSPEQCLAAFAGRLQRRHARMAAVRAVLRTFLPWGALGGVALWFDPRAAAVLGAGGLLLAAVAGLWAARRRVPHHLLLAGVQDAPEVQDALGTWLERRTGTTTSPMVSAWLAEDLWHRASSMPARAWSHVGQRPLGAVRWLLPLLVLLLWGRFLVDGIQLPLPGAGGGAVSGAGAGGNAGQGQQPGGSRPELPEPPPVAPEPPPTEEPEPPPPEPDPLLQLPPQEQYVVPQFVGDGPSRKALAERAEVEMGGGSSSRPEPRPAGAGAEPEPRPAPHDYQRAAERAERARNVPVEERPVVRRFFDLLRKEGS